MRWPRGRRDSGEQGCHVPSRSGWLGRWWWASFLLRGLRGGVRSGQGADLLLARGLIPRLGLRPEGEE
eukprot:10291558-Heterocapsa_arctica.AAC.1